MAKRKRKYKKKKKLTTKELILSILILIIFSYISYYKNDFLNLFTPSYAIENVPSYTGKSYVVINNNIPNFTEEEKKATTFEHYSELDLLGRCGKAFANISIDLMPSTERESIGMIKPSGWQTSKYDFVDGKYLYNRCHLIGYQLTGENANPKNLITCTRSMNTIGMLEFENKVAKYIKDTKNHVLYRVTPIYEGSNLLSSGVEMEAYSIEDKGHGISFHVYVYNVEKGVTINYKDGTNTLAK